jgi:hypothetical protein
VSKPNRKKAEEVKAAPQMLLCTPEMFFVFTKKGVCVDVLTVDQARRLWERLTIAEGCRFIDTVHAREQVVRFVFGPDAEDFIPATSRECLMYYTEHYTGRYQQEVQGLSACILLGTPFTSDSANPGIDGSDGQKVPVAPVPKGSGPTGAMFDKMLRDELEVMSLESSQI